MKKKLVFIISVMLMLALSIVGLAACNPNNPPTGDKFTVQFNLNYPDAVGSVANQEVVSGAKATVPQAPVRENFVVRSWYKEATLATPFDFAQDTITADTTLYAGWTSTLYHLGASFNGYVAKDDAFRMNEMVGKDGWFELTVELTEENRDPTYDGHYYKVTNGTWDASGTFGVDNYAVQPAPTSPTGGGLGSIYIFENRTLTIQFDSVNKVVYDNSMERAYASPMIYGDFNTAMDRGADWSLKTDEALSLTDPDGNGIFTGLYKIPAYTGEADGYSMAVAVAEQYLIDLYGSRWSVSEQYKLDGTAAGMGGVSYLNPTAESIYEFKYDSTTHITTATVVEKDDVQALANPTVYGDFSAWAYEGSQAITLTDPDGDGNFVGFKKLAAYSGADENGYMLAVGISKILYDDQYGIRWGMNEQYKFDGTAAGMGGLSYLKPLVETIYEFKYNSTTHITTVTEVEAGDIQLLDNPTVYGDFSGWLYEGSQPIALTDVGGGVYEGSRKFAAYTGEGDGYMLAVGISKTLYDDQWGIRWGMSEQYKFDGSAAGMGGLSYLKPTEETTYSFSFDSATKITTVTIEE